MGCYADASLLLLGAEKAESVAGQMEVVQDGLDLVGCVLGSTARLVPPMGAHAPGMPGLGESRQRCTPAWQHQQPRRGPPGTPGSVELLSPAPLHLRGKKCSKPIFYTRNLLVCRGFGSKPPPALPAGMGFVWMEPWPRGGRLCAGGPAPARDGCQLGRPAAAVWRLRRDAVEGSEQMAGR